MKTLICDSETCKSKKLKYKHSFLQEHVYTCKKCGKRVLIKIDNDFFI